MGEKHGLQWSSPIPMLLVSVNRLAWVLNLPREIVSLIIQRPTEAGARWGQCKWFRWLKLGRPRFGEMDDELPDDEDGSAGFGEEYTPEE